MKFNNIVYYTPEILSTASENNSSISRDEIGQKVLTVLSWNGIKDGDSSDWYLKLNKDIMVR